MLTKKLPNLTSAKKLITKLIVKDFLPYEKFPGLTVHCISYILQLVHIHICIT